MRAVAASISTIVSLELSALSLPVPRPRSSIAHLVHSAICLTKHKSPPPLPPTTTMKFTAVLAAAAAALVGSVSATACTSTQSTAAYVTLVTLLTKSYFSTCASDSGYSMLTATALPTTAQYELMCASTACHRRDHHAEPSGLRPDGADERPGHRRLHVRQRLLGHVRFAVLLLFCLSASVAS